MNVTQFDIENQKIAKALLGESRILNDMLKELSNAINNLAAVERSKLEKQ